MAAKPVDSTSMLSKAETAFRNGNYAQTYELCSELMKGKTASVVVYMQCVSALKLRENTKDFVDAQIGDTLLLAIALDNFYVQSDMQNQNIVTYVTEIIFTLLTSLIANIQKNYPFKSPKRSFKNAFSGAQASISNLRKLKVYDFSKFHISLPTHLIDFAQETAEKLIAHVTNSINITKDVTNNWLYEDETDDLFERIVNYKIALSAPPEKKGDSSSPIKMRKSEIDEYIADVSNQTDEEFKLEEIEEININPPAEVKVNADYTGESERVTVSKVLGKPDAAAEAEDNKSGKSSENTGKSNTLNLTGQTQLIRNTDTKAKPQTKASAEAMSTIEKEFKDYNVKKEKTKDVFVMPEALDNFSSANRTPSKKQSNNGKRQPIDLLIGIMFIFLIIAVAYIVIYFLSI